MSSKIQFVCDICGNAEWDKNEGLSGWIFKTSYAYIHLFVVTDRGEHKNITPKDNHFCSVECFIQSLRNKIEEINSKENYEEKCENSR